MNVQISNRQSSVTIDTSYFKRLTEQMLGDLEMTDAEISVIFVDSPTIADLHLRFMQESGATDIITFPLSEPGDHPLEGELVICAPWAAEVAQRNGDSVTDELVLYLAHGLIHLTGQDDIQPEDAQEMRKREHKLLSSLNLVIPRNRFESIEG
ncbi:MAG: rRNA maturation RNase YbeY [Planctomycetota bacterium]